MAPWITRADLARLLGVTRPRITAIESAGQLPPAQPDPDTHRMGWPSGEAAHLMATRQSHQASRSLASLMEAQHPLPVNRRMIVDYHRATLFEPSDSHLLAIEYTSDDGPIVFMQPLSKGTVLDHDPEIFRALDPSRPSSFNTDTDVVSAIECTYQLMGYDDPYGARWIALGADRSSGSLSQMAIGEIIVETNDAPQQFVDQPRQPFETTWHDLPRPIVQARLGTLPTIMPAVIRSAAVAEAWAAAGWSETWKAPTDLGDNVQNARTASILYGISQPEINVLADVVADKVTERPAPTEDRVENWLLERIDGALPLQPLPILPATPPLTPPESTSMTPYEPHQLVEAMDAAQLLLDFTYVDGVRPEPIIARALRAGISEASYDYGQTHDYKKEYRPRPAYMLRTPLERDLPEPLNQKESQTPYPSHVRILKSALPAVFGASHQLEFLGEHRIGEMAALRLNEPSPAYQPVLGPRLLVMAPALGGVLAHSRQTYQRWSRISVSSDARAGLIWVEVATDSGTRWLPMPLARDTQFTTGYWGTGPDNTTAAITAFLSWTHDRKLTQTEAGIVRDRIGADKSSTVVLQREHLVTL